jgi:hypothetical protein
VPTRNVNRIIAARIECILHKSNRFWSLGGREEHGARGAGTRWGGGTPGAGRRRQRTRLEEGKLPLPDRAVVAAGRTLGGGGGDGEEGGDG